MSEISNFRILEDALIFPGAAPTARDGQVWFDAATGSLVLDTGLGAHRQTLSREITVLCLNKTGVQIDDGAAVYLSGAQGNRPTIALASTSTPVDRVLGVVTHDIANNAEGAVTIIGEIDLDTSGFAAGEMLYLSSTPGVLDNTPGTPAIPLAKALNATVSGRALVFRPQNVGYLYADANGIPRVYYPTTEHNTPIGPTIAGTVASVAAAGTTDVILLDDGDATNGKSYHFGATVEVKGATEHEFLPITAWNALAGGAWIKSGTLESKTVGNFTAEILVNAGAVTLRLTNNSAESVGVVYQAAFSVSNSAVAP